MSNSKTIWFQKLSYWVLKNKSRANLWGGLARPATTLQDLVTLVCWESLSSAFQVSIIHLPMNINCVLYCFHFLTSSIFINLSKYYTAEQISFFHFSCMVSECQNAGCVGKHSSSASFCPPQCRTSDQTFSYVFQNQRLCSRITIWLNLNWIICFYFLPFVMKGTIQMLKIFWVQFD